MDNILYIIVGLVIIAGIAFVVMRGKNKPSQSQTHPSQQPSSTPSHHDRGGASSKPAAPEPVTKFDNETVAQRFIDQQRYDKAVEAIDRGLAANPTDSALLLKLLQVYIATGQTDAFYQTYAKLETHADPVTMVQAQQLKADVDREHAPIETVPTTASPSTASIESAQDFSSLSFDVEEDAPAPEKSAPTTPVQTSSAPVEANNTESNDDAFDLMLDNVDNAPVVEETATPAASEPNTQTPEEDFGFTLDGFENTAASETEQAPVTQELPEATTPTEPEVSLTQSTPVDSVEEDFDLELDTKEDTVANAPVASDTDSITLDESESVDLNNDTADTSTDDDFTLDFESLLNDTEDSTSSLTQENSENTADVSTAEDFTPVSQVATDSEFDLDINPEQTDTVTPAFAEDTPASVQQDNTEDEFAAFNLFESETTSSADISTDSDDTTDDGLVLSTEAEDAPAIELDTDSVLTVNDSAPVTDTSAEPQTSDEAMLFDDNFDFDTLESATSDTPVSDEPAVETPAATAEAPTDTSLLPPTDEKFDFVKTLDSNQVTLELAEQYLSIGEYDGAKHLLNEVLAEGNSEQKAQANTLLARTA